ncbi:BCCT family transporter [Vibrio sp. S4M6]|uniref:BCCT family transporter n=1 Tax=Vibrio sinus TaxID=2946865 RepID=UPI00202AA3F9|nr:BCCT family transporter [Vibrio sinus]MCL9781154.1 BCCT family transporter [Vibrio sinus]
MRTKINTPVFASSFLTALLIVVFTSMYPHLSGQELKSFQHWLVTKAGWLYILSVAIFLIFIVVLATSRLGQIKLGPNHSEPEFGNISWFAMLFSAGMGIGLMFFGVAEPALHYMAPPVGTPETVSAAQEAMRITFFHWGLHAWAIYALVALVLAYFSYRHDLPLLPRSAFYPLIGERIYGPIGHIADTFAVLGTLFGVATSLGYGVQQLNAGLHFLFNIPQSNTLQFVLIIVITLMATLSVVSGLDKGIKILSNVNILAAVALLIGVITFGPTQLILSSFVQNTGTYLSTLVSSTFNLYAYQPKESWLGGWTLLYWGWWISWSPFVGVFIARISKGRTIREFIIGVLLIPAGFTFLWMTAFGNTAINAIAQHGATQLVDAVNHNVPVALFVFFEHFPFAKAFSLLSVFLVVTFFITSADSGALVIDNLASGGEGQTPVWQRVFWTSLIGIIAATTSFAGGLQALQTLTIASAFPFMLVMLVFCYCLIKALREDYMLHYSVNNHTNIVQYSQVNVNWKERLDALVSHPKQKEADNFIHSVAIPALEKLSAQFRSHGYSIKMEESPDQINMTINKDGAPDFNYAIRLIQFSVPTYAEEEYSKYYRAEVFLHQGGQDYDVLGYTQEQIIADAITQYEKHLHFIHLSSSERLTEND